MVQEKKEIAQHPDVFSVAPRVWGRKDLFVNYYIIQDESTKAWALVDAGLKWSAPKIKEMALKLFGADSLPVAIILTHGHFDHVGALATLAAEWHVPIYAHSLEMPYLNGASAYPPADPTVGGGMMATMSFMYPKGPIDVQQHLKHLPHDNTIPGFPEWKYLHTPGHSAGHISLFRELDKVLIAGDAIVTTKQESAFYALSYKKHLSGPPKYFTCNWASAKISVLKLAALAPEVLATGHGHPMKGEEMRQALHTLSIRFNELAQPKHGRYVNEPAVMDETGVLYLPAAVEKIPAAIKVTAISLAIISLGVLVFTTTKSTNRGGDKTGNAFTKTRKKISERFKTLDLAFSK